jgi:predicted metal-dependent hydrolase
VGIRSKIEMKDDEIKSFIANQSALMGIDEPYVSIKKMRWYGAAAPHRWSISLRKTHVHEGHDAVVKDTIIHELAHLKEYWISGKCGHGKLFKSICLEYGAHPHSVCTKKIYREIIAACKRGK